MPGFHGSCLCGEIQVSSTLDPVFRAVCHCRDCRKRTSYLHLQVPKEGFKIEKGEPKIYLKKTDHGSIIQNHFCPTCGTLLYCTGGNEHVDKLVGVRGGIIDSPEDAFEKWPPSMEVYVQRKPSWFKDFEDCLMLDGEYRKVIRDDGTDEGWKVEGELGV